MSPSSAHRASSCLLFCKRLKPAAACSGGKQLGNTAALGVCTAGQLLFLVLLFNFRSALNAEDGAEDSSQLEWMVRVADLGAAVIVVNWIERLFCLADFGVSCPFDVERFERSFFGCRDAEKVSSDDDPRPSSA